MFLRVYCWILLLKTSGGWMFLFIFLLKSSFTGKHRCQNLFFNRVQASTCPLTSQSWTKRKITLNFYFSTTFWKCTGREAVSPHIFNMQILLLSCLWALLGSRNWIIFPISSVEHVTEDSRLSIRKLKLVGRSLWLAIREHYLQKKTVEEFGYFLEVC